MKKQSREIIFFYKPKKCILCNKIYKPTSGSQKACDKCKKTYFKFCTERWRINNWQRVLANNRRLRNKWKNDPIYYKKIRERQNISKAKTRQKYGKEYRKILVQRNKDRIILLRATARKYARCNRCNSMWPLQCHHKDINPSNHNFENLEWICKQCHDKIHYSNNNFPKKRKLLIEKPQGNGQYG